jgi:hypothetical protein
MSEVRLYRRLFLKGLREGRFINRGPRLQLGRRSGEFPEDLGTPEGSHMPWLQGKRLGAKKSASYSFENDPLTAVHLSSYRGTSLISRRTLLGPCCSHCLGS